MTVKLLIQEELYQEIYPRIAIEGEGPIAFSCTGDITNIVESNDIGIVIIPGNQLLRLSDKLEQLKKQLPFLQIVAYIDDEQGLPCSEVLDGFLIEGDSWDRRIDNIVTITRANKESRSLVQDHFLNRVSRPLLKDDFLVPPWKVKMSQMDHISQCFTRYAELANYHGLGVCLRDVFGRWDVIKCKYAGEECSECQQTRSSAIIRRIIRGIEITEAECPRNGTVYLCPVLLSFNGVHYPVGMMVGYVNESKNKSTVPVLEFCENVAKILSQWITDEYYSSYFLFMENIRRRKGLDGERIYRHIIDSVGYGIITIDCNKTIVLFNKGAERFLDMPAREAMGRNIMEVTWEGHVPQVELFLHRTLESGIPYKDITREFNINGKVKRATFDTIPVRDSLGKITGAVLIFEDVTSRVEEERRRERWEKEILIEELAASIAHEIKNPLSVISGFLQIIRDKGETDRKTIEKYANMALKELDSVKQFLEGYLRQRGKGSKTRPKVVDVGKFLEEYIMILKASVDPRKVGFHLDVEEGLPSIIVDPLQLEQIILNLVQNAVQAFKGEGSIWIRSYLNRRRQRVIIEVIDDGPGIPRQYLKKIFKPFFTTKEEGTGLGLSISRRLVIENGGTVEVESREGKGTKFTLSFPQCNL